MALSCNIGSRGKLARLIYGIVLLTAGVVLGAIWARGSGSAIRWLVCILLALGGGFAIFEARAGWCAVRALGIKTPM